MRDGHKDALCEGVLMQNRLGMKWRSVHHIWAPAASVILLSGCTVESDDWQQKARALADSAESRVAELSNEVDSLQIKLGVMTSDRRADLEQDMEKLEAKRVELESVVSELRETTRSSVTAVQEKAEEEIERLNKAIEELKKRLADD